MLFRDSALSPPRICGTTYSGAPASTLRVLWDCNQQIERLPFGRSTGLPDTEADWIPSDQKWRHVLFLHGRTDWTHEREWRCPNDIDLTKVGFYVIVWSAEEASEVTQLNTRLKNSLFGVLPMEHLNDML